MNQRENYHYFWSRINETKIQGATMEIKIRTIIFRTIVLNDSVALGSISSRVIDFSLSNLNKQKSGRFELSTPQHSQVPKPEQPPNPRWISPLRPNGTFVLHFARTNSEQFPCCNISPRHLPTQREYQAFVAKSYLPLSLSSDNDTLNSLWSDEPMKVKGERG